MDRTKEIVDLFDRHATQYQHKYMEVAEYRKSLDRFCAAIEKRGAAILDIACGPGNITQYLLQQRPDFAILGTDLSENMIALAKENNPQAEFALMDMRDIGQLQQKFSGVVCGFGLPYLSKAEVEQLVLEIERLLEPGGCCYLSTMEGEEEQSGYQKSSDGKDVEMYTNYFQAEYLAAILEKHGLTVLEQYRQGNVPQSGGTGMDLIFLAQKKEETKINN